MISENIVLVYNTQSQALGLAVAVEPSPYVAEELAGVRRVKVWAEVPSAGNKTFYGWDWWPLTDTVAAAAVSEEVLVVQPLALAA